jgi:hypothetical protein
MGQQAISGIAAIIVVTFLAMALAACSTSAQVAEQPHATASIPAEDAATPEFHGARISRDALRSRLPSES